MRPARRRPICKRPSRSCSSGEPSKRRPRASRQPRPGSRSLDREREANRQRYIEAEKTYRTEGARIEAELDAAAAELTSIDNAKARLSATASTEARAAAGDHANALTRASRRRDYLRQQLGLAGPSSDVAIVNSYGIATSVKNLIYRRAQANGTIAGHRGRPGDAEPKHVATARAELRSCDAQEKHFRAELVLTEAEIEKLKTDPRGDLAATE